MRLRILFITLCFLLLMSFSAFGQTQYDDIKNAFQNFTDDFANTLPALSTVGLNWSDAYIGGFPHFGVGATLGVAFIPYDSMEQAAAIVGGDLNAVVPSAFQTIGMPLPMWAVEGRLGGFVLPFDVGVKVGFLPPDVQLPANITLDFLLIGADFRYGILEDLGPVPDVSIGIGVNWLSGSVGIIDAITGTTISTDSYISGSTLNINTGDFNYNWQALTIDLKAQVSKNFVFITISGGFSATFSVYAEAGGGMESQIQFDQDGTGGTYSPVALDSAMISGIESKYPGLNLSGTSFIISGSANGWSFRAFAGLQFDLLIFKIDISGNYNVVSGSWGGNVNLRTQF